MKLVSLSCLSLSCCLSICLFEIIGNKLSREGHDMERESVLHIGLLCMKLVSLPCLSVCLSVCLFEILAINSAMFGRSRHGTIECPSYTMHEVGESLMSVCVSVCPFVCLKYLQ